MVKIVADAGHSINTPGKRSPNDEREWTFNDKVVDAFMLFLSKYENVQMLRVDDSSGKVDIPLSTRTNKANAWGADVYISFHHNALTGVWGDHGGVETFTHPQASEESKDMQKILQANVLKAMGITDRGAKSADYHVLRETKMPAVLIEGGFMDSRIDIKSMRDDKRLKAQGEVVAKGLVEYFGLKLKEVVKPAVKVEVKSASNPIVKPVAVKGKLFKVQVGAFADVKNAERLAKELKAKGYATHIVEV
jgi:N-acetylmuramoyl-L-alanine amidase